MNRNDAAFGTAMLCLLVIGIVALWMLAEDMERINDEQAEYDNPYNSPDYLGDGVYACPHCNWTGYVGLMVNVVQDGVLTSHVDYYCPVCGAQIDVRDG